MVLAQLIEAGPSPAVALVALFKEALDSRGIPVEQRLRELLVSCAWGFVHAARVIFICTKGAPSKAVPAAVGFVLGSRPLSFIVPLCRRRAFACVALILQLTFGRTHCADSISPTTTQQPPPLLYPPQPFLDAQLAAPSSSSSSEGGSAEPPAPHFTQEDLSTALLAAVAILPDLMDDVPKSPVLVAELVGHFMAAGQLTFNLKELAAAVREAGGWWWLLLLVVLFRRGRRRRGWHAHTACGVTAAVELLLRACRPSKRNKAQDTRAVSLSLSLSFNL